MSALFYSFVIFACVLLLSSAILCIPAVIYMASWLLSEAYALYLDYQIIQANPENLHRLLAEYDDE